MGEEERVEGEQERDKRDTQMETETVRQTETEAMPNVSEMQKKDPSVKPLI